MRVWIYLCVVSSHINTIGRYVMRVWVYLCVVSFCMYHCHRFFSGVNFVYLCACDFSYLCYSFNVLVNSYLISSWCCPTLNQYNTARIKWVVGWLAICCSFQRDGPVIIALSAG